MTENRDVPRKAPAPPKKKSRWVPRTTRVSRQIVNKGRAVGRNEPCPCGSGRKYKKCCIPVLASQYRRDPKKLPKERPRLDGAEISVATVSTENPAVAEGKNATATAMLNANVSPQIVWAYLATGLFINETNISTYSADDVERWKAAIAQFDTASDAERQEMLAPALP